MNQFGILDLLSSPESAANIVEVYVCPPNADAAMVGWKHALTVRMPSAQGGTTQDIKNYHHRDMTYSYDLENGAQRVVRKLAQACHRAGELYAVAFNEEVIPIHRFPSTRDMSHVEVVRRTSWRINNRMYIIDDLEVDTGIHYHYIRYQHSDNVDARKMQSDFERALRQIRQPSR